MKLLTSGIPVQQFANPEAGWKIEVYLHGSEYQAIVTFRNGKTIEFRGTQAHAFNSAVQFANQNPQVVKSISYARIPGSRYIGMAVDNNRSNAAILADLEKDLAK